MISAKNFGAGLLLFQAIGLSACIWIHGTRSDGEYIRVSGMRPARELKEAIKAQPKDKGLELEKAFRGAKDFEARSDFAVGLMYLGQASEAIQLLEKLEAEKPGDYSIAANLGTAYELAGNNQAAHRWIATGIQRNSESHYGTEWLHLRILEAKIAAGSNPDYFKTNTILGLQPGNAPAVTVAGRALSTEDLDTALRFQLKERLTFVKPPDAVVAALLFDYAALESSTATLESALELLRLAGDYGFPLQQLTPFVTRYERIIAQSTLRRTVLNTALIVAAGLALGAILVWLYRRGTFVLSSRDLK